MAENDGLDLSRVVNLIMENPKLIEEISALVKSDKGAEDAVSPIPTEVINEERVEQRAETVNTYKEKPPRSRRNELLGAMKPYLSKERARAIDSMLTIVDVLDMMKER